MGVRSDHSGNERGAFFIEMALLTALLLMMATSVVEIGRYLAVWHGAHTAARAAVGYSEGIGESSDGVAPYTDCSEIKWAAVSNSGLAELQPAEVEVTHVDRAGTETHSCTDANVDPDPVTIEDAARVVITVKREVSAVTPLARFLGPVHITATESVAIDR